MKLLVIRHGLAEDRRSGKYPWLRPDSKSQVSVVYNGNTPVKVSSVLVSTQHAKDVSQATIRDYVVNDLAPRALGEWFSPDAEFIVNPSGSPSGRSSGSASRCSACRRTR